uniref:Protein SIEVE ELEMENT OCCLUSION B-like n=1 Tax=Davidia involucrata TaxID=16924 RepID=A0A5B6ZLE0_DAVIN
MANAIVPAKMQQVRSDRHFFSSSDDNAMMKQIQATHAPDGREFDVKPLLHIIEDIMHRAGPTIPSIVHPSIVHHANQAQLDALDDKAHQGGFSDILELLAYTINRISCEISCKCSGGGDAHATTVSLFNSLSNYSWDAKVVIALAAFGVNYGEFWLVAQLYPTDPLAKSVAFLKQLPDILERAEFLKPKFEALTNLIKAMLDVTKCIVEFKELPSQYITPDTPAMLTVTAHIPTAVYWTIRSIVACASQIMNLIGLGHEYIASTTEAWELSSLAHKVSNIHSHLRQQLALCYQHIDEKSHIEAYQTLGRLFETPHIDNMKILRALIYAKEDQLPLFDGGPTKKRTSIDVLRRKNVLLFISDLDLAPEELAMLEQMFTESRQQPSRPESQYEVVWLPVVDKTTPWDELKQKQFETVQASMPWYSVHHPSLLEPAVIKYIKEVWRFNKKPLLVVLDPQGRVVNPNALHMMWIWGSLAFPFTSLREEALWKLEETWRIELLADTIDPSIFTWISERKFICLYGGEDIEWIRKFTNSAQAVARAAKIQLEMLYVGRSNPREKVRRNNATIQAERLSHVLPDLTLIWFFWVRLESMWHSKVQHGRSIENDPIMQEIMTMLTFDGSDRGWAVISLGSSEMAKAKGETFLQTMTEYDLWKDKIEDEGFLSALNGYLHELHTPHHCNRLILPGTTGSIPERVVCAECGRPMERFIMYRCCTD